MRLSYNSAGEITDQNDYYPFGMNIPREEESIVGTASLYNYKYNGKELQETGMYDYGARFYMPDAVIWGQHDPLSEKTLQPYAYAYNNPVFYNDPTGMAGLGWIEQIQDGIKSYTYDPDVNTVEEAIAADYEGVTNVYDTAIVSREDNLLGFGGYSYRLTSSGAVYDLFNGLPVNSSFITGAGTNILNVQQGYNFSMRRGDGIMMMGGDVLGLGDLLGLFIGSMDAKDQQGAFALGVLAIIASKGRAADDVLKAEAKSVVYTKSSLSMGREMHKAYKVGDVVEGVAMKEFRSIPGIRPDFVDFRTKTIYELKPFNPRAMKAGEKQLLKYKTMFENKYPGTIWNTVLDTY